MPHYQNSVIYKIKRNDDYDDTDIYVGSTANFTHRKSKHKYCCNNEKDKNYNTPVYKYIRDNGGWDEWVMIPIEQYPCNNKDELKIRERYHIDLLKSKLNQRIPSRTDKEWRDDNKEKINEYWRNNKDKKYEKDKRYRESHKEILVEKKKQYREANKEKIAERDKKYREANKEILSEKAKQRVVCDNCGCEVSKKGLNAHQKTKKCLNFVKKD
jgi:hypothetical protein